MKKRKIRSRLLILLAAVLAALGIGGYAVFDHYYSLMGSAARIPAEPSDPAEETVTPAPILAEPTPGPTPVPENTPEISPAVYHLLLLGVDSRYDTYNTRTDSMMMITVNREKKEILLTSYMRDIYIYIPDWGYQRLNVANIIGGPEKIEETIEYHFGIPADNYLFVNFYSFRDAIDTMGGVDLTLSTLEVDHINARTEGSSLGYQSTGIYHLNGAQALSFCRDRSIGADMSRTEQQRRLIAALWDKAKKMSLGELSSLAEDLLSEVVTDMDRRSFLSLLSLIPTLKDYSLDQQQIPADGTFNFANIGGASVLEVDFEANRTLLQNRIYG